MLKAVLYDRGGTNVWLFHLLNQFHNLLWDRLMLLGTALGDHRNFPFIRPWRPPLAMAVVFAADALGPVSVSKVTNLRKDSGWRVPTQYSEVPQHVQ